MKRVIFFFLFFLCLYADVKKVVYINKVYGEGEGYSRVEAVNNALIEAISQLNGVKISSIAKENVVSVENKKGDTLDFVYSKKIERVTNGKVDSYKILNVYRRGNKYFAKVEVVKRKIIYKYIAPGQNNRRSIVIMPFEYNGDKKFVDLLYQKLLSYLTQTRKFAVIDRLDKKYYDFEKQFLLSQDINPKERARLKHVLGVDYYVIGKINSLSIEPIQQKNYYTGEINKYLRIKINLTYKVINIPTMQIKWANTISETLRVSNLNEAVNKIAREIVEDLIFNIYPPVVIALNPITINMGGKLIKVGEIFDVYKKGEKLIDPYTKEFLGYKEIKEGKIQIVKVTPKLSYAEKIEGKIEIGDIIRKSKLKKKIKKDDKGADSYFNMMFSK